MVGASAAGCAGQAGQAGRQVEEEEEARRFCQGCEEGKAFTPAYWSKAFVKRAVMWSLRSSACQRTPKSLRRWYFPFHSDSSGRFAQPMQDPSRLHESFLQPFQVLRLPQVVFVIQLLIRRLSPLSVGNSGLSSCKRLARRTCQTCVFLCCDLTSVYCHCI